MSDRPQKYGYYFRITIAKKKQAESQIETIIESNNSRNLLNDSTTRRKRPGLTDVWNQSFS